MSKHENRVGKPSKKLPFSGLGLTESERQDFERLLAKNDIRLRSLNRKLYRNWMNEHRDKSGKIILS